MAKKWLKRKVMNRLTLFDKVKQEKITPNKFCFSCKHRKRFLLNEHSNRIVICCELQPSKHSNSGYRTIKAHDYACGLYEQIIKQ